MSATLPRSVTKKPSTPFITLSDEAVVRAVNRYHLVTAEQLTRLLSAGKSAQHLRSRASHLADDNYLLRNDELRPLGPIVYSLGPKGRSYLRDLGISVPERLKKPVVKHYGYGHLKHALGVTDLLIAADLLAKHDPRIRVQTLFNEHALKRKGVRVTLPDGAKQTVCPDAWLDFRIQTADGRFRSCLAVEFDRGSEWQPAWREKVRAILAWVAPTPSPDGTGTPSLYEQSFGTDSLTVAVLVDAGAQSEARVRSLLRWTEAELTAQHAEHEADLFAIAAATPVTADPTALFCGPLFAVPFSPAPTSLLAVAQGSA